MISRKRNPIYKPDDDIYFWKDIPGYNGRYQISREGVVRRIYKKGVRDLCQFKKKAHRSELFVKLCKDGCYRDFLVGSLVAITWIGPTPKDMVAYHKNGIISDNRVENIGYITRSELGRISGDKTSKRNIVFKIDSNGNVVEIYRSARAAARDNYMSHQTMLDRCHNRVLNPYVMDGYDYQFEDRYWQKNKLKE